MMGNRRVLLVLVLTVVIVLVLVVVVAPTLNKTAFASRSRRPLWLHDLDTYMALHVLNVYCQQSLSCFCSLAYLSW